MYAQRSTNKYKAVKTYGLDGCLYDSKFEASVANELFADKKNGEILHYEPHYKIEIWLYNKDGEPVHKITHKVDFRVHHVNGVFELREAKGVETREYKFIRKLIENVWLHEHYDHFYTVVKEARRSYGRNVTRRKKSSTA